MHMGRCCHCGPDGATCAQAGCCRDTIIPVQSTLVVADPGGGTYACRSYYYGSFYMTYEFPDNCNVHRSINDNRIGPGSSCPLDPFVRRYAVSYLGSPDYLIRVDALSVINSSIVSSAGRWEYAGTDIQCLREIVLTKVSVDHGTFPMPNTVTLTPF